MTELPVVIESPSVPAALDAPTAATTPPDPAGLVVRDLAKSYRGRGAVFAGVDLHVAPGEAVALIGSNGCGKSTLLRCCLRLIEPDAGEVELLGEPVTRLRRGALRRLRAQVGLVFQRHNLVPRLSALTNVIHGAMARSRNPQLWFHALAPRRIREEAMGCLARVGLAELADRRADHLSGGESQRVAIARALMQHPRFVMADEPAASLDPKVGREVMALFVELIHREGLSLLYVSHNLEEALEFSDRVVALADGRVALDARSDRVTTAELRSIYG